MITDQQTISTQTRYLSKIVVVSVGIISLVHLIGFIDLNFWMEFSGAGNQANELQNDKGHLFVVLLNLSALLLFVILTVFYYISFTQFRYSLFGIIISWVFVLRGFIGFVTIIIDITGTATHLAEFFFSIWALLTGISALITYKEGSF